MHFYSGAPMHFLSGVDKQATGAKLGNRTNLAAAQAKGFAINQAAAIRFAVNVLPVIRQMQATGATGYRAITAALNAPGVRSPRGGDWHATTVRNLMQRQGA
jgi:hypothetical protein